MLDSIFGLVPRVGMGGIVDCEEVEQRDLGRSKKENRRFMVLSASTSCEVEARGVGNASNDRHA